jgi:hypothetical protein
MALRSWCRAGTHPSTNNSVWGFHSHSDHSNPLEGACPGEKLPLAQAESALTIKDHLILIAKFGKGLIQFTLQTSLVSPT